MTKHLKKIIIPLAAVIFLGAFAAKSVTEQETADSRMLKNLQKSIQASAKKQLPVQIPEKYYSKLNITTPLCTDSVFEGKLASCSYYKCFKKRSVGDSTMYVEVIIHGLNRQKNCAISYKDLRYFVPPGDLKHLIPVFDESSMLHEEPIKTFYSNDGKKNPVTVSFSVPIQTNVCKVNAIYQIELDTKMAVVSKTPPTTKIEGIVKVNNNNGKFSYYEFNKVIYSPKYKNFSFIPKLLSYSLAPQAPAICKDKSVLLMFDLEKRGQIIDIGAL